MYILHRCYWFCAALSQSELSNAFTYIIITITITNNNTNNIITITIIIIINFSHPQFIYIWAEKGTESNVSYPSNLSQGLNLEFSIQCPLSQTQQTNPVLTSMFIKQLNESMCCLTSPLTCKIYPPLTIFKQHHIIAYQQHNSVIRLDYQIQCRFLIQCRLLIIEYLRGPQVKLVVLPSKNKD